jgi:starvation-inducible DNA-binding protein
VSSDKSRDAYRPAIEASCRARSAESLQATLVELIDLSLLGKQLHWSVVGPGFRSLHLQLDEFVDSWRELADDVAERMMAIGAWPEGQASAVSTDSSVAGVSRGPVEDHILVHELAIRLLEVAARVRGRLGDAAGIDVASEDLLTGVLRALEEQLWTLRAQLPATSGASPSRS